jgi:hypothetical protein
MIMTMVSVWLSLQVDATDDDYARPLLTQWCFNGNNPTSIHRVYLSAVSPAEAKELGQVAIGVSYPH